MDKEQNKEQNTVYIKVELDTSEAEQKTAALAEHLKAVGELLNGIGATGRLKHNDDAETEACPISDAAMQAAKEKQLKELVEPIVQYLRENYNPYASIIITSTGVTVKEDTFYIPFPY